MTCCDRECVPAEPGVVRCPECGWAYAAEARDDDEAEFTCVCERLHCETDPCEGHCKCYSCYVGALDHKYDEWD